MKADPGFSLRRGASANTWSMIPPGQDVYNRSIEQERPLQRLSFQALEDENILHLASRILYLFWLVVFGWLLWKHPFERPLLVAGCFKLEQETDWFDRVGFQIAHVLIHFFYSSVIGWLLSIILQETAVSLVKNRLVLGLGWLFVITMPNMAWYTEKCPLTAHGWDGMGFTVGIVSPSRLRLFAGPPHSDHIHWPDWTRNEE